MSHSPTASSALAPAKINVTIFDCIRVEDEIEIDENETLGSMLQKVQRALAPNHQISIFWAGRGTLFYHASWSNFDGHGPQMSLSGLVPDHVNKATGIFDTHKKNQKLKSEVFAKLKVTDICDLKNNKRFGLIQGKPKPKAASSYETRLSSAEGKEPNKTDGSSTC